MPDYGRPVGFGVSLVPEVDAYDNSRALARVADEAGLELIGIQDHPYQRRFLETWMLMAALLAETTRVSVFPDVTNLPLRLPAMIAKQAASLDAISGGRFELGLGAGSFWDAIAGMGGPRRSPRDAVDALEEAIQLIRLVWSGERSVSFEGEHYRLSGYKPGPSPPHPIGIWVGAYRPRMLGLTGRLADGWIPSLGRMPPEQAAEASRRVDDAASEAGRDPREVRRLYNVSGTITGGERGERPLDGPAEHWVETLALWALELGLDTFVFWPDDWSAEQLDLFVGEVVPGVRAAVERARS